MKVIYNGKVIELEEPEEGEQDLDVLTKDGLEDTQELTEEEIEQISLLSGDKNE